MFVTARRRVRASHLIAAALVLLTGSLTILRSADTALLEPVRSSNLRSVTGLLASGADPNASDDTGATLLMHAAAVGSLDVMRALVAGGAQVNAVASDGTTALMWATGDLAKVEYLLEHGADLHAVAKDGTTALVAATQRGSVDVVRALVARKAAPMASGEDNLPLLQAAFSTTSDAARDALAAAGVAPRNFSQVAPALARIDAFDHALLARYLGIGGDPNLKLPLITEQMPILGYAAMVEGPATVRMLLARGADPNAASTKGATPLMMAAAAGGASAETVRLLMAHGARADAIDAAGQSALDWALKQGDTETAQLLRRAGAPSTTTTTTATVPMVKTPLGARAAVAGAIASMDAIGPAFYEKNRCVSCHNQSLPAMARTLAAARGVTVAPAVASHADAATVEAFRTRRNAAFAGKCGGSGYIPTITYALVSMAEERTPSSTMTDAAAVCLASRQSDDGSWKVSDIRPPLSGNPIVFTALAIRALDVYAPPALRAETAGRLARARAYLTAASPQDTQDEAFTLMGLVWARAEPSQVAMQSSRVEKLQRADGGWGQTPSMPADAYATGQALFALRQAGAPTGGGRYRHGTHYLLRTQREDGSWFVQTRGFGFQPYGEFGFAHGASQFLSAAATSWAVMALTPTF